MGEEVWILLFLGERNFKWDFPADRDRWESVSFSFIIVMTMAMALIDDYNDDCRYDQSTAEAFRAVQKSGEMVMIIVLYHFISCNPFFGVTSKSKVSILIPWRHPSNPRIPSNAPRYPPKPLQTSPWKVHTTILLRPPCRLWNPPKALITSPWIKSKISPTPSDITQQPPDTLLYPGEKNLTIKPKCAGRPKAWPAPVHPTGKWGGSQD